MRRPLIFVMGMGRSGTSVLCRLLSLSGATLHDDVLGATAYNERGHWEAIGALDINEPYLRDHGSSWFDPGLGVTDHAASDGPCTEKLVTAIRTMLRHSPDGPVLALKEPRITGLADVWLTAARLEGFDPCAAIAIRHPDAVAASLARRDDLAPDRSHVLWLKYSLLAEEKTRAIPRVFVDYDDVLADWPQQIGRIAAALNVPLDPRCGAIEAFLSDDLRHARGRDRTADGTPVRDVYAMLSAATRGVLPDADALDAQMRDYRASSEPTAPLACPESPARVSGTG